jgi:hypothetical protein
VGEKRKEFEPHEPYQGYKFIDYKEKESGKYYRSYWVDNNTSELCVHYGKYKYSDYANAYRSGKCIVKKELKKSEVSRWEVDDSYWSKRETIIPFSIKKDVLVSIKDRKNNKVIGEIIDFWWSSGYFIGRFITGVSVSGRAQGVHCIYDPYKSKNMEKEFLFQTLKQTIGEK